MPNAQKAALTALDAIFTRRSVRTYSPQKLDDATVRALLDAAVQAPTAVHLEPWAFAVVQDPATLKALSDRAKSTWSQDAAHYRELNRSAGSPAAQAFAERLADPDFNIFYDATTLIVICARPLGPFVVADCWLAAENLMLAATAMGLGSCCVGSAVPVLSSSETRSALEIPDDVQVVAPIVVGVPRGSVSDASRKAPDLLCWKRPQ